MKRTRVKQMDLWVMLLGYVRYSMGRMSMAPTMAQELIHHYGAGCNDQQLRQIRDEIAAELETYDRMGKPLGMECDHKTWQRTLQLVEAQLAARTDD